MATTTGSGTQSDPFAIDPTYSPTGFPGVDVGTSNMSPSNWFNIKGGSLTVNSGGTYNGYLNGYPPPEAGPGDNSSDVAPNGSNYGQTWSPSVPTSGANGRYVNNDNEIYFQPNTGSSYNNFNTTLNLYDQTGNDHGFLIYASQNGPYNWNVDGYPPGSTGPDGKVTDKGFAKVTITYNNPNGGTSTLTINIYGNPWGMTGAPWNRHGTQIVNNGNNLEIGTKYYGPYNIGHNNIPDCLLAGTLIATPTGLRLVEDLQAGDEVNVWHAGCWQPRTVTRSMKHLFVVNTAQPYPDFAGWPVVVEKDAIAPGVPNVPLRVTPEHCLYFDGGLVPVRMLVNDVSIRYDRSLPRYEYFHIEVEPHGLINANNVLTESWLDASPRGNSEPARSWATHAAAPLQVEREFVEPIWQRLAARAEAQGGRPAVATPAEQMQPFTAWVEAGENGGKQVLPLKEVREDGKHIFTLPALSSTPESLALHSEANRPCDVIGPFVDDRRTLGMLVGNVTLVAGKHVEPVTHHLEQQTLQGWALSNSPTMRWTSGAGHLPLGEAWSRLAANLPEGQEVELHVDVIAGPPSKAA